MEPRLERRADAGDVRVRGRAVRSSRRRCRWRGLRLGGGKAAQARVAGRPAIGRSAPADRQVPTTWSCRWSWSSRPRPTGSTGRAAPRRRSPRPRTTLRPRRIGSRTRGSRRSFWGRRGPSSAGRGPSAPAACAPFVPGRSGARAQPRGRARGPGSSRFSVSLVAFACSVPFERRGPPHRRGSLVDIRGRYGIETAIGLSERHHSPKRVISGADPQCEGLARACTGR
jgi:hypothetical protein